MHLHLIVFLLLSSTIATSAANFYGVNYLIDCGGSDNFTSQFNWTWLADRFYSGGASGLVAAPGNFQRQEKTIRFFPISFGKKNCYEVGVPNGRYYIRKFTVYDNYDSKMHPPSFEVSIEGTMVFSWRTPWPEVVSKNGAYSDVLTFVDDGEATVCFYSIATDPPVIGSLEVVQVDPLSYGSPTINRNLMLVNYGRLSCGSNSFGPGFTYETDLFGRGWQSDSRFRQPNSKVRVLATRRSISGSNQSPNYFPTYLYQTAVAGQRDSALEYLFPVDTRMDYMLWFHFAEIDASVSKAGQRIFDIHVNQLNVSRIDIFDEVGGFAAFKWQYTVRNLNDTVLRVQLVPIVGPPLISGLENYALVPRDLSTLPSQVTAMRALKESLKVPERMGWNGDPCAPSTWDAWEGVTCHQNKDETGLVITQLDLGSQGLKGYISDQISLLTNLVSLNLSLNSLSGSIPSGIAQSIVRLDLSSNELTGTIPESLTSSKLQLVLLNDNQLEGQVPELLYSIGVHGGAIDLSGNKALCGVPSLPACSFFWEKGGLSTGGKIAIGLSCLAFFCGLLLIVYCCCIRKGDNDYDFALPQDLMSIAAKRNRYHRAKSMMVLEMETQNSNGYPATFAPH